MSLGGDVRKCGERVQGKLSLLRGVLQQRRLRSEQRTNRNAEFDLAQLRIISHPFQQRLSNLSIPYLQGGNKALNRCSKKITLFALFQTLSEYRRFNKGFHR